MTHRSLSQAEHVVTKLGGINATARLLGHKSASTVQGWVDRGFIPGRRQASLLSKAREAGLALTDVDFIVHLRENGAAPGEPSRTSEVAA